MKQLDEKNLIPGSPIVSLCGTPIHDIGLFIDHFLVPLVKKQYTYIKDTSSFINSIQNIKPKRDCSLVTFDAKNMYTCFTFNEILEATNAALTNVDPSEYEIKVPQQDSIFLLRLIL